MTLFGCQNPRILLARFAASLISVAIGACSVLQPSAVEPPAFFSLNFDPTHSALHLPEKTGHTLPTLIVTPPHAAAGFDSQRIIYVRKENQLEYFARSEWVDTPARMLGPLLASSMDATGIFGAVVVTPAGASGDLRLETEIVRLQHNFVSDPSRAQFTLRAFLLDEKTRQVLAWREISADAPSASNAPREGVAAANRAVGMVLAELAQFVAAQALTTPRRPYPQ
jgi:cholesterol transport system auxiliary component